MLENRDGGIFGRRLKNEARGFDGEECANSPMSPTPCRGARPVEDVLLFRPLHIVILFVIFLNEREPIPDGRVEDIIEDRCSGGREDGE